MQASSTSVADRIHFEGFQPKPQQYLLSADIFVLASLRDPCPLVIPEAREAGCAIIASDVDGIPELLEKGNAGNLVKSNSPNELAQALKNLLENPSLTDNLRKKSSEGLSCLSAKRVCKETLEIYSQLLL